MNSWHMNMTCVTNHIYKFERRFLRESDMTCVTNYINMWHDMSHEPYIYIWAVSPARYVTCVTNKTCRCDMTWVTNNIHKFDRFFFRTMRHDRNRITNKIYICDTTGVTYKIHKFDMHRLLVIWHDMRHALLTYVTWQESRTIFRNSVSPARCDMRHEQDIHMWYISHEQCSHESYLWIEEASPARYVSCVTNYLHMWHNMSHEPYS